MKTSMQELLEWVRATLPMDLDTPMLIEEKIKSLLEKEKEQMIDFAFKYGDLTTREIADAFDNEYKK
jgi:hypothetical protein